MGRVDRFAVGGAIGGYRAALVDSPVRRLGGTRSRRLRGRVCRTLSGPAAAAGQRGLSEESLRGRRSLAGPGLGKACPPFTDGPRCGSGRPRPSSPIWVSPAQDAALSPEEKRAAAAEALDDGAGRVRTRRTLQATVAQYSSGESAGRLPVAQTPRPVPPGSMRRPAAPRDET